MESRKLWQAVLGELEMSVSRASFSTWFKNTAIIASEDGHLTVAVPNIFTKEWLEKKHSEQIKGSLSRMGLEVRTIEYRVMPGSPAITTPAPANKPPAAPVSMSPAQAITSTAALPELRPNTSARLNARYSLADFVVGASNELAYAAAQAVVKFPGDKYNPLFLYGGVGLGKTHLMQAVGNELLAQNPDLRVRYITSEEFTNEYIDSVKTKRNKSFAQLYRNLDVLIIDDIQFIGNKEKTQEEFFHTFNTLHQAGKQIILSSDKPPRSIPNLESRLRSRFEMSMSVDIQRPDLETRAAIIQTKAVGQGANLPLELVEYLARQYQHNIRELEGALTQLIAYCDLRGIEPSVGVAKDMNGTPGAIRRKHVTPKTIIEKTAAFFNVMPSDITGMKRDKGVVIPRQIAMYLMRKDLNLSYPKIAAHMGGRDHSTAMHSVNKIEKLVELDEELRHDINQVKERINL